MLVELKARLDEEANIVGPQARAGRLPRGVRAHRPEDPLQGLPRRSPGGDPGAALRPHRDRELPSATARVYEDLGLLTADERLTEDVTHLFNVLTGYSRRSEYDALIVAPLNLRRRMLEMIEREAERSTPRRPGRIAMKMNALVDVGIVDALYAASQRGVAIDLLVRGPCILRARGHRLSERSGSAPSSDASSSTHGSTASESASRRRSGSGADMMDRNLDRRFEALVRIDEPALMDRLDGILDLAWADTTHAWNLRANGKWARVAPGRAPISLQDELMLQTQQA